MAPNEEGGNLQTFNFQYFGFYPGYVTLHSKANKYQAVIIGSNFNTNTIPTVKLIGSIYLVLVPQTSCLSDFWQAQYKLTSSFFSAKVKTTFLHKYA